MKHFQGCALIVSLCLVICSAFLVAGAAFGQSCEQWGGKIVSVQGVVEVKKAGESKWIPVGLNATYCPGDMIRVLKNSRAAIVLSNETLFRLDQNTSISFTGVEKEKSFLIEILKGVTHFFSRHPRKLKVVTPFLNAAVEGTEFYVRVEQDQTFMSIFEGRVVASNIAGGLALTDGQSAVAKAGKAPVLRVVVRPWDAVQWALYYLPVLYVPSGEVPKEDIGDPRFLAYRASQMLAVGRVDEAGADIERALSLNPKYSDAFALQSIIAVVQNEKDKALSAAQKAIDTGPNSATARLAMSYAQQTIFDIQGALKSIEEAVNLDPENALAWSRLAELFLSMGDLTKATEAAQKSVALNPILAHTQTIMGFTYIDRVKIKEAKETFIKAIELESAAPLARLGLGLAMIRGGDLKDGRAEIEIAASLDPSNSLIRSYLGKAYYEEKRDKLAESQYDVAKKLDALDPTAWFYDAIRKQTINRPVEALHDMQKSIELNDNRAVYRSRLLLDEDLAARSASLGRIYNNLGFQQLGLVEGWKSVNTAADNYSAHRLLADLYAALPRHEIARVSELLQSQLLQPINITPVQPQLAESNLFILDGAGPSDPSFNEFNPLFLRNRFALQASGVVGENDTLGDDLIQSTVWDKLSYSLGQFHYETDGFRENNDQNQDIYNAFAQVSLSPKTSLQGEFRYTDSKKGDLELRFDPDDFRPGLRKTLLSRFIRFGFHHNFSPRSDVIGSFIFENIDDETTDTDITPAFTVETEDGLDGDTYLAELQYLFGRDSLNITVGGGYLKTNNDGSTLVKVIIDPSTPPLILTDDSSELDIHHTNAYFYAQVSFPKNLIWTLGGSADFFEEEEENEEIIDRNQFNPKLGLTWNPFPKTQLRAALFRVLRRTLTITKQTLEPTQVAGFNQFFDDDPGTRAWRYGVAIDQKISADLYGGVEYSKRDLDVQARDVTSTPTSFVQTDWEEQNVRAYLYWTPHDWLALNGEYLFERQDREEEFNNGVELVKTHRFPLGINFFHPSGWSARAKATYYRQNGKFNRLGELNLPAESGSDNFWLIDASVSYRLPRRFGIITLAAKNLFDKSFNYHDTDLVNPIIQPERLIIFKATLSF